MPNTFDTTNGEVGESAGEPYALITGASSGIGEAFVRHFLKNGINVIAVGKDARSLAATTSNFQAIYPKLDILAIVKDLSRQKAAQELFDEVAERYHVEYLVNNAGQGQWGKFVDIAIQRDIELIRLNVETLTRLTKLFLPPMVARGHGRVLNVGSVAGFQPGPMLAVYHATKAFVVSLSEALAEEVEGTGVTVTCLCPGPTDTHFFDRADMQDTRVVRYKDQTMMPPDAVAEAGFDAMMNGERLIIPGMMNKIMTFSRRVMPVALQAKSQKQFYETSEETEQPPS